LEEILFPRKASVGDSNLQPNYKI